MKSTTPLKPNDILPLTCSRAGTCCYGKLVMLNPWELAQLAHAKGVTPKEFRDRFCDWSGLRLRFNGKVDAKGQSSCSQYSDGSGCSVYLGRPLVCRLFPLGRQKQRAETHYIYEGAGFPCLTDCPEVLELPQLKVGDYLKGQETEHGEAAQDAYLDFMKSMADGAFSMFLDSGLAATGDRETLKLWSAMGQESPESLAQRLGAEWIEPLMVPELKFSYGSPLDFSSAHHQFLQSKAEQAFGASASPSDFSKASVTLMGLALFLGRGLGANPVTLSEHWVREVKGLMSAKG
jgi:Fe-S-cluster containining protein